MYTATETRRILEESKAAELSKNREKAAKFCEEHIQPEIERALEMFEHETGSILVPDLIINSVLYLVNQKGFKINQSGNYIVLKW